MMLWDNIKGVFNQILGLEVKTFKLSSGELDHMQPDVKGPITDIWIFSSLKLSSLQRAEIRLLVNYDHNNIDNMDQDNNNGLCPRYKGE